MGRERAVDILSANPGYVNIAMRGGCWLPKYMNDSMNYLAVVTGEGDYGLWGGPLIRLPVNNDDAVPHLLCEDVDVL